MVQYDLAVADVPPYDLPEEKRYKQVLALLEQQRKKDDAIFSDKRDPSNMWSHEQLEYFLRWSAEIIVADSYFRYFGCSVV